MTFRKDEMLFKAESEFKDLYLIIEGSVGIFEGDQLVEIKGQNQVIGERGLISGGTVYLKTAIAMEDTFCWRLNKF